MGMGMIATVMISSVAMLASLGPDTIMDEVPGNATLREVVVSSGASCSMNTNKVVRIVNAAMSTNTTIAAKLNRSEVVRPSDEVSDNGKAADARDTWMELTNRYTKAETMEVFRDAVLDVKVDFATNTTGVAYVAVTNMLAGIGFGPDTLDSIPSGRVYGSIGAIIVAIVAAVVWLRKRIFDNDGSPSDQFAEELLDKQFLNDTDRFVSGDDRKSWNGKQKAVTITGDEESGYTLNF